MEPNNKTGTCYESKCLCSEQGHPRLLPSISPVVGEPNLQVKDRPAEKTCIGFIVQGTQPRGWVGIETQPRLCLLNRMFCEGLDLPEKGSLSPSCQVVNQCSCSHLEGFLILTPPEEDCAGSNLSEGKQRLIFWMEGSEERNGTRW